MGLQLFLILFLSLPAAAEVKLIYPGPSTAVTQSRHLILKLGDSDLSTVIVTVNGIASDQLHVDAPEYRRLFRDFLILQPAWDKGKNRIQVETFKGDKKIENFSAEIFYAPKTEPVEIPKEFTPAVMHRSENESLCVSCHNMRPTARQFVDAADKDNPCYSCHKRMGNQKNVHTPVGMYSCIPCHPLQGSPKYAVPKRESALCFSCHQDKQKEFKELKYLHGPLAGDMCEICHDPHSSDYPEQLRQPVNKLCLSCHDQVAKGIHVVSLGGGAGHPVSGSTDPSERGKGRELSCISCHNPHGGQMRYYFVTGSGDKMELCQMCHKK
jgi:predicted CXXCH cytochrome family protein